MMYGVPVPPTPVVSKIRQGGAAEAAGLQTGDRIVSFNGIENPKWDRIRGDALLSPEKPLPLVVERDGQRVQLTLTPAQAHREGEIIGDMGFEPDYGEVQVIVAAVEPDSPAAEAGLQAGDRFVSIGGEPVRERQQVTDYVREHKGEPIQMVIERDGQQRGDYGEHARIGGRDASGSGCRPRT